MWLLFLGVAPVPEPRVLDDPPEDSIRHGRGRRRVEEPRDDYGGLGPVTRAPASKQRPHADQSTSQFWTVAISPLAAALNNSGETDDPENKKKDMDLDHFQKFKSLPKAKSGIFLLRIGRFSWI